MSSPEIENIIATVFAETGVKLTADDPIVAVLLIQQRTLEQEILASERRQADARQDFLNELAKHEKAITDAAAELRTYRQQILTEILQKADAQQDEVEAKMYAGISKRVMGDHNRLLQKQAMQLKLHMAILAAVLVLIMGVFVFISK